MNSKRIGVVLGAVPVLFLTFDAAIKIANARVVREGSVAIGFPPHLAPGLGVLLLAMVALYCVRRTAVVGAVLLTGYLGGAVAIHTRILDPLFSHTLFPVYVAVLLWGSLYLRDARVRALTTSSAARGAP